MYDPISEKYCEHNLRWVIDGIADRTDIIIISKSRQEYKITIPRSNITVGQIFEIANDFCKSMLLNLEIDISDYF